MRVHSVIDLFLMNPLYNHIMIKSLLKRLFSYLFPPSCIICGNEETIINVCKKCRESLPLTREMRRPWLFSLYRYRNDEAVRCIRYLKDFPDTEFVYALIAEKKFMVAGWSLGALRSSDCDRIIIVPTPIHRSRFLDRGYNQAEIIAHAFAQVLRENLKQDISIEVKTDFITKSKKTHKQALITDRTKRLQNIKSAFQIKKGRENAPHFPGHPLIIIIDDVTTTGGTLDEIRTVLLPHAKAVFAFTLAH
jgi:predicted amidophosphoribosyltransferase